MSQRVQREKEAYNTGLKRKGYHRFFLHCDVPYRRKRKEIIQSLFPSGRPGEVLEIGSQSWRQYIDQTGITPNKLVCINISEKELAKGEKHASSSRLDPEFLVMDAHALQFPDNSYDVVFGSNILHHLDMERVLPEIKRVLKPGGVVFFREPLDFNPIGRLIRLLTPRARTPDERPFRQSDVDCISSYFSCRWYYEQFFSVPIGVLSGLLFRQSDNSLIRFGFKLDESLLKLFPFLSRWYRYVTFTAKN